MDALKMMPSLAASPPVRAGAAQTAPSEQPTETYTPRESRPPVSIFLTRQQVLELCQPKPPDLGGQPPAPAKTESANETLKKSVPGPVKMVVDGYTLPGTQTTIKPRFDNGGILGGPTGVNVKVKF